MEVLIFCGGFGTRMNKGKAGKLKPLLQVGGKEILRHIISIYERGGIKDFILLGGYKIEELRKFASKIQSLNIKVLDTGVGTSTGGRLLMAKNSLTSKQFLLTYGDSLTNYNLNRSIEFKKKTKSDFVVSAYYKKLEYGVLKINREAVLEGIYEKTYSVPINAGFYMLDERIFPYIRSKEDSFEIEVLPRVIGEGRLLISAYQVDFWHPMDTPADREKLDAILKDNPNILYE